MELKVEGGWFQVQQILGAQRMPQECDLSTGLSLESFLIAKWLLQLQPLHPLGLHLAKRKRVASLFKSSKWALSVGLG